MANPSKAKGRQGEHEFARRIGGKRTDASGMFGGGDIDTKGTLYEGYHVEVKRRRTLSVARWMEQAENAVMVDLDADGVLATPVVAMREDRGNWMVLVDAEVFEGLLARAAEDDWTPLSEADQVKVFGRVLVARG